MKSMCWEIEILQHGSKTPNRMDRVCENQGPLVRMVEKKGI